MNIIHSASPFSDSFLDFMAVPVGILAMVTRPFQFYPTHLAELQRHGG
ncbi:MAG: hypothetical protein K0Q77_2659, partial [Anaerosporomusa subterranea]|nr:hypothetical protein [Anaerosporomusa subterranea]